MTKMARSQDRHAVYAAFAGAVAAWLTWRCAALGAEIAVLQQQLAAHLRAPAATTTDASIRVARVIQADDALLDRAIALGSARQVLLWISIALWLLALVLASHRWWRRESTAA